MIFVSVLPIVILGIYDWINLAFHWQRPYVMHYSAPFIFLLIGWLLLRRFGAAINAVERLNAELEDRIQLRERELTEALSTIHTLEKKRMLKDERERIMRDIHDGVGGQLVSALAMMENDGNTNRAITDSLTFALDDMRLIIDSLAPEESGLSELLAMFKYRSESKLKEYGITLYWQQADWSILNNFSPQHSLQLLRIIQEAFTNILKHAQASLIEVRIEAIDGSAGGVSICICDNGIGFTAGQNKMGRGLRNMQRRASEIGQKIAFFNLSPGACVQIQLHGTNTDNQTMNVNCDAMA